MEVHRLPIEAIVIGERSRSELRNVESLAHSIRERSLLQPPVVRRDGDRYVLVCGRRRLAAMESLGWTETPVTVAESIADELGALYAEGDENTEREPFTVAEAVEHRRRIREVEGRAAKERQREHGGTAPGRRIDTSSNLEEVSPSQTADDRHAAAPEPRHERTTRHRTAKATGYGATTLDKAERILAVAEDETQPEPVRKVAREAAENLGHHGAKVDREFKAVQEAVVENSDHAQAYRDAQWRQELAKELQRIGALRSFDPERVVAICDGDVLHLVDSVCQGISDWHSEIARLRQPGLRVIGGQR